MPLIFGTADMTSPYYWPCRLVWPRQMWTTLTARCMDAQSQIATLSYFIFFVFFSVELVKISHDMGFGNNWFGLDTSSPFSLLMNLSETRFLALMGLLFLSWLEGCQEILYTYIHMFSFVMVWVLSPLKTKFVCNICFRVGSDGFGLSLEVLVQKYLNYCRMFIDPLPPVYLNEGHGKMN